MAPTVEEWLDSYSSEDFAGTYETLTPKLRAENSLPDFERNLRRLRAATGAYVSKSVTNFTYQEDLGQASVGYDVTFEDCLGSISFNLERSKGTWRVSHWGISAPALSVCQNCGLDTGGSIYRECPRCKAPRARPR